jgi:hypothetical protein
MTDLLQPITTEAPFIWRLPVPEPQQTDWLSTSLQTNQTDGEHVHSSSWSKPVNGSLEYETSLKIDQPGSGSDIPSSSTSTESLRFRPSETDVRCWRVILADLLDQALTVDAFIEAARQAFGETCTVVPIGEAIAMQQAMPPNRIIITEMVSDMVTEACCY